MSDTALRELFDELLEILVATTSATFAEKVRSLSPHDLRALLLDQARKLDAE